MATYDPRQTFKAQELSFSRAAGTQTSKQQGLSVGAGTPNNNRGSTYDEVPQVITSSPLPGLGSRTEKEDKKEKTFTEKVYDFFVGAGADVTEPEKDFYAMPVYESPMFKIPTVPEVTEQGIVDPFDQFNVNPFKFGGYDDTRDAAPQVTQTQDPDMNDPRRGLMAPPTMDQPSTPEALTGIPRGLALGNATPTKSYRIKDGDTLSEIAKDNNTTVKAIMDLNAEIEEADVIDAGDTIQLPLSATQAALRGGFDRDKEGEGVEVAGAYPLANALMPKLTDPLTDFQKSIGKFGEGDHGSTPVFTKDAAEAGKPDSEKSLDIGYGHKIIRGGEEDTSGEIYGIKYKNEDGSYIPLTDAQKLTILRKDFEKNTKLALDNGWNKKLKDKGSSWDLLDKKYKNALTSLAMNVGGAKAGDDWTKVLDAAIAEDPVAFAKELRRKSAGEYTKGMDNRVMKELYYAGIITNRSEVQSVLPKANMGSGVPN